MISIVTNAELAPPIAAPAHERAIVEDSTGVPATGCQRGVSEYRARLEPRLVHAGGIVSVARFDFILERV